MTACQHYADHGEGVEWPAAASLEHFDKCVTAEQRWIHWMHLRDSAARGWRCEMADHAGALGQVGRLSQVATELAALRRAIREYLAGLEASDLPEGIRAELRAVLDDLDTKPLEVR